MLNNFHFGRKRILLYYFLAIVLPSVILGVLAFRGVVNDQAIDERESRRRLNEASNDIIEEVNQLINESEIQFLKKCESTTPTKSVMIYFEDSVLTKFLIEDSLINGIFFVQPSGNVQFLKSGFLYFPDGSIKEKDHKTGSDKNFSLQQGWQYEYQENNNQKALNFYRNQLKKTNDVALAASLKVSIARIQKKLSDNSGAVNTYNLILENYSNQRMDGGFPLGVVALIENAKLYLTMEDTLASLISVNSLIQKTIDANWDLEVSQYNQIKSVCNDLIEKCENSYNGHYRKEVDQYSLLLKKLEFEENRTKALLLFHDGASTFIGKTGFKSPESESEYRLYISQAQSLTFSSVFPQTIKGQWGLILNVDYLLTQINRLIIPSEQRLHDFQWQLYDENRELLAGIQTDLTNKISTITIFPSYLPSWSLVLFKEPGNFITTFFNATHGIFLYIFLFIVAVLLLGLFFTLQVINRELVLSKMKSDFISTVSHEFKSPLTSVRQMTEMLNDERIKTEARKKEYYALMLEQTERLSHLIDNILDFSRIEEGRKEFRFEPASMELLLSHAMSVFQKSIADEGFEVSLSISNKLPEICIDQEAIQQVIYNLLDNAYKYSGNSKEIRLSAEIEGKSVLISIQDFGIGIQRNDRDKIFERFYRGGNELTRSVKGSGIGLTIVKRIIEAHGGKILFESIPGKGSTFYVSLPVASNKKL